MRRAKIAPNLSDLFSDAPTGMEIPQYAPARRELRSLVAVFRAAERHAYWLRATHPDDGMPRLRPTEIDLIRAVSGRGGRGKRGSK